MNKERTESNIWYLVIIHVITSGFLMPLFLFLVITAPLTLYVIPSASDFIVYVLANIVALIGIIWGIYISANYLNKKYFIRNKKKLVNYSTGLVTAFLVSDLYFMDFDLEQLYINAISYLVIILFFYIFTNRWIKSH